jgi:tetratricopeptide (TPR) repeat protein
MRPLLLSLFILLTTITPAHACLWDTDTPGDEASKNPDVYKAIIGWFDRNPDLYYQMRLDRVTKEIATNPSNLNLYDDAAVACDRLGKSDDSIDWMTKKRAALDKLNASSTPDKEHEYRYLANLGTFHAHRWVRQGADRTKPDDITKARDLIAQAIKLNPDAHFGREKIQLAVIKWLIVPTKVARKPAIKPMEEASYLDPLHFVTDDSAYHTSGGFLQPDNNTAQGLAGLVVLGNAWNSFDIYVSLAANEAHMGNGWLEILAWERSRELASQKTSGRASLHPAIETPQKALALLPKGNMQVLAVNQLSDHQITFIKDHYRDARAQSDRRHEARTAFMLAKLNSGMHPDIDAQFWQGWTEPPLPQSVLPLSKKAKPSSHTEIYWAIAFVSAGLAAAILAYCIKKQQPAPTSPQ